MIEPKPPTSCETYGIPTFPSAEVNAVSKSSISHFGRASPVKWIASRCSAQTWSPASFGSNTEAPIRDSTGQRLGRAKLRSA